MKDLDPEHRLRVAVVFGTRPEASKLAPVIHSLRRRPERFETCAIVTGQHRELLDGMVSVLRIEPDRSLNLMRPGQTLNGLASRLLAALEEVYAEVRPDVVLVQGDTTTTFIGALAAFHEGIRVGHVEAGLRTFDLEQPFPEEANRQLASRLAAWHFAPTRRAADNLVREGIPTSRIHVTGNTAVDAMLLIREYIEANPDAINTAVRGLPDEGKRLVTLTCHRRESFGEPMARNFRAVRRLADEIDDVVIVYPVHPNPNVQQAASEHLSGHERIRLIEPLDYPSFVWLMEQSVLLMSDSGAVQEEAPSLGVPVLILREVTERPECIDAGAAQLVGTSGEALHAQAWRLLTDEDARQQMVVRENPYGDGTAGERIVGVLGG